MFWCSQNLVINPINTNIFEQKKNHQIQLQCFTSVLKDLWWDASYVFILDSQNINFFRLLLD
jgi:hypothetical protein